MIRNINENIFLYMGYYLEDIHKIILLFYNDFRLKYVIKSIKVTKHTNKNAHITYICDKIEI